ncbi:MAG: hypothetical protein BYD32DRAFT_465145 [Podila humilis]|nr:MAG: hypothetical protein BYD32DRAFT_465145 [Podila humilis]
MRACVQDRAIPQGRHVDCSSLRANPQRQYLSEFDLPATLQWWVPAGSFSEQHLPGVTAPNPSEYQDYQDRIVSLIKSNPRLKWLNLRNIFTDYGNQLSIFSANQLPLLERDNFFEDLFENIRSLNVDISIRHMEPSHDDVTICYKNPRFGPLCIRGELAGQEEYILLQFLQSCFRTLHIFYMRGQGHLVNDTPYQCIESHWLHDGLKS